MYYQTNCPYCSCPHCGRPYFTPYNPYPVYPYYSQPTITWGNPLDGNICTSAGSTGGLGQANGLVDTIQNYKGSIQ